MSRDIAVFVKKMTCFAILIIITTSSFAQFDMTVDRFKRDVLSIEPLIREKAECDAMIEEFDDFNDALEAYSFAGHTIEQINIIRKIKKYATAMENFLRTTGEHSYMKWTVFEDELGFVKDCSSSK